MLKSYASLTKLRLKQNKITTNFKPWVASQATPALMSKRDVDYLTTETSPCAQASVVLTSSVISKYGLIL